MGAWWGQLTGVMGLTVILGQMLRHHAVRAQLRRAAEDLKALAAELGLEYVAPTYANGQGMLRGIYRGRRVRVDPDEAQAISVRFESSPRVALATYSVEAPEAHDMIVMSTADDAFDAFWKTRRAAPELANVLSESARNDWLAGFRGALRRNIGSVSVSSDGVTAVVDFGSPRCMPSHAIRTLLSACTDLAQRIEPRPGDIGPPEPAEPGPSARPAATNGFASVLWALAVVAFTGKLVLAWWMDGAGDAGTLQQLATWAHYVGRDVYLAQPAFGLPPAMVPVLGLLDRLADATGLSVGFWSRVLAGLADAGMLLLAYRWLHSSLAEPATRWSLVLVALLPVALACGGSWGGWQAGAAFFVLLSVYWAERRPGWLAGGAFGVSLCITLAPLYVLPALLLARRGARVQLSFAAGVLLVLAACWLPWCPSEPSAVIGRLVYREGAYGRWGLAWWLTHALGPKDILHSVYASAAPYLLPVAALAVSLRARYSLEPPSLLAQVGVIACIGVAVLPSFALRDLCLLVGVLICAAPLSGAFFALSSTALVLVDAYGSGSPSWSLAAGVPADGLSGNAEYFQAVCFCSLLALAWSARAHRHEPAFDGAGRALPQPSAWRAWAGAAALAIVLPAAFQVTTGEAHGQHGAPERALEARARDYVDLSSWLLVRGMNRAGIEVAQKATVLYPQNAAAWNNLAVGHSNQAHWDEAIASANQAVALDPGFQLARNNLAWARDHKRAALQFRALSLKPHR